MRCLFEESFMPQIATLQPTPPYDFPLLLNILSRYAHPTLDIVWQGAYWRVLRAGSGLALVRVSSVGTVEEPALTVALMATQGDVDADAILPALHTVLPLQGAPAAFYAYAQADARLWSVVEPLYGMPDIRSATLFESLMQAIIEQQIAWVAAQKAQRWLVEWADNRIDYDGRSFYAFPSPAQMAAAVVDDLLPLKITFKRMALMIDLAQRMTQGELNLESLAGCSAEAAYGQLTGLKGIGHWTAAVALQRAYGHGWVAHNDVALQAACNRYFHGGKGRIPAEQLIATFAAYDPYAAQVAGYTLLRWVLDEYPMVKVG
jgi:DNA-3-methyladenine glycosylase II